MRLEKRADGPRQWSLDSQIHSGMSYDCLTSCIPGDRMPGGSFSSVLMRTLRALTRVWVSAVHGRCGILAFPVQSDRSDTCGHLPVLRHHGHLRGPEPACVSGRAVWCARSTSNAALIIAPLTNHAHGGAYAGPTPIMVVAHPGGHPRQHADLSLTCVPAAAVVCCGV
jgi:hypothetical protein